MRLEPLSETHHDDLVDAVRAEDLWKTWYTDVPSPDAMSAAIEKRRSAHADGSLVPWAVIDTASGRAVGMTTYLNIDPANRRLEIGSTWLGVDA